MKKIGIVAHDAGAANHIVAWIKCGDINATEILLNLSGPASTIYEKTIGSYNNLPLDYVVENSELLISGTGWSSDVEHNSRFKASRNGIYSVAVIDHWTNYRERFIRGDTEVLPDEIWVTDKYALSYARSVFPRVTMRLKVNRFLMLQIDEIKNMEKASNTNNVLFLMEPIRSNWNDSSVPGEIQALDFFLDNFINLGIENNFQLKIRPHPSDFDGKYDEFINDNFCEVDAGSSLAEALAWADVVVGCQTYAMVVALHAGKKVVSSIPDGVPDCILPYQNILHLKNL